MSAFNARKRYLTGLGLTPSQAYRKRRLIAGLGRLGDDSSDFPSLGPGPSEYDPTIDYGVIDPTVQMAITGAGGQALGPATYNSPTLAQAIANIFSPPAKVGSSVVVTPATAATMANSMFPTTPASTTSWLSTVNPTFGVSNGMLLAGIGGIGLLVMLSGRRR